MIDILQVIGSIPDALEESADSRSRRNASASKPIAWRAIRRSPECFRYRLAACKQARLMLEGHFT